MADLTGGSGPKFSSKPGMTGSVALTNSPLKLSHHSLIDKIVAEVRHSDLHASPPSVTTESNGDHYARKHLQRQDDSREPRVPPPPLSRPATRTLGTPTVPWPGTHGIKGLVVDAVPIRSALASIDCALAHPVSGIGWPTIPDHWP